MKYKQHWFLALAGVLALVGCDYRQGVIAQPQKQKIAGGNVHADNLPQQFSPSAALSYQLETYDSQVMGGNRTYGVCLPFGYEQNLHQRYPVIFLLHGGHGSPTSWFQKDKGAALATFQQLYAAGKLPPSIIITPDGNDRRGSSPYWDPQYIDGTNGNVSTAIGDELVKVVQNRYRTLPSPDFWAIGGLSSGAWGAVNIGLHHLNHFSILFSHSGYFVDKSGPQNSPMEYVKSLPPQAKTQLRVYLDTGLEDQDSLEQTLQFHQVLTLLQIPNKLNQFPGSHTWRYWRQHLADSLTFVGQQFQAQLAHSAVQ